MSHSGYISDILLPFSRRTHRVRTAKMSLYITKIYLRILHLKDSESALGLSGGNNGSTFENKRTHLSFYRKI